MTPVPRRRRDDRWDRYGAGPYGSTHSGRGDAPGDYEQLYKCSLDEARRIWRRGRKDAADQIQRLQRDLGCTFSGAWRKYVECFAPYRTQHNCDPHARPKSLCEELLDHAENHGYDVVRSMEALDIEVDWREIRSKWMRNRDRR